MNSSAVHFGKKPGTAETTTPPLAGTAPDRRINRDKNKPIDFFLN